MKSESYKKNIPTPISIKNYLTKFCDLHGPVSKSLVYNLGDCLVDKKLGE